MYFNKFLSFLIYCHLDLDNLTGLRFVFHIFYIEINRMNSNYLNINWIRIRILRYLNQIRPIETPTFTKIFTIIDKMRLNLYPFMEKYVRILY